MSKPAIINRPIGVAIVGMGTVGTGAYKILNDNGDIIRMKVGNSVQIKKVLDIDKDRLIAFGVPAEQIADSFEEILNDENIDIVIELIGGENPAYDFILRAIDAGKNIVTANKMLMAKYGRIILDKACEKGVDVHFEASVGGGIPIIRPLKQCLAANRIKEIMGIVNGTTNFILTKMTEEGADYSEVLAEAQKLGYAEADPSADVDGFDAMYKLAILSSIGFIARISIDKIYREGISKITKKDIQYAKELGCIIKLLAIAKDTDGKIEVRVHPTMLPLKHPLAQVNGVFNAIYVKGDAVGEVMFYGPGAGQMPTGSAVVSDVIEISRNLCHGVFSHILCTCFEDREIKALDDIESSYYVRLCTENVPGVLAQVAKAFGDNGVSINSVIQKGISDDNDAEVVWITDRNKAKDVNAALEIIESLPVVKAIANVIRVER